MEQFLGEELRINDANDNARAERALNAASRQIDAHTNRRFWQDSALVGRKFRADDAVCCLVDDISTVTGLVVQVDTGGDGNYATTLTIDTHFLVKPYNAAAEVPVWPYDELEIVDTTGGTFPTGARPGVKVTAKFGWPAVPTDVEKACIIQATMLFKAGEAAFGAAQLGADGVAWSVGEMHRTARGLLEPYIKRR